MRKIFIEIWNERPHVSELSGKELLPIGHPQWHWQFAHILGKNVAPSWKYNKDNILLVLPEEHENQETYLKFMALKAVKMEDYFNLKRKGIIK
jgi:hypothetical protein